MSAPSTTPTARIEWLRTVVDDGRHNAVTDLCRWQDRWWLAHRRADRHHAPPAGDAVVLVSEDLVSWRESARFDTGRDDRDPKLTALDDRLLCTFGSAHETWGERDGRPAIVARAMSTEAAWSEDGESWTTPRTVAGPGWWLWGLGTVRTGLLAIGYGDGEPTRSENRCVDLFASVDGEHWNASAHLLDEHRGTEGTLLELDPGRAVVVVRGEREDAEAAHLFLGEEPWTTWVHTRLSHAIHAPALAQVGGRLIAAGRDRDDEGAWRTKLWLLDPGACTSLSVGPRAPRSAFPAAQASPPEPCLSRELLTLPSGGDNSYPGLVPDGPDALLVSWYSQHEFQTRPDYALGEGPASIYLARVRLD